MINIFLNSGLAVLQPEKIKDEELQHEIERLEAALLQTRKEISEIQDRISTGYGYACGAPGDNYNWIRLPR